MEVFKADGPKTPIGFDTETDLIGRDNVTPNFICASFAMGEEDDIQSDLISVMTEDWRGTINGMLSDEDYEIIAHNWAFDARVITKDSQETMDLLWEAMLSGRIKDTLIREKLLNLVRFGNIDLPNGRKALYDLASLEKYYLQRDRSEFKKEGSVRTQYEEFKDLPIEEWPEEAVQYAEDDAVGTLEVYLEQELLRREVIADIGIDPFAQEEFRVAASFALSLMEDEGLLVDKDRLKETRKYFEDLYYDYDLVQSLVDVGIVIPAQPPRPHSRGAKDHVEGCNRKKGCDCPVKMTKPTKESTSVKTLHQYIWDSAKVIPDMEVWLADSTVDMLREDGQLGDVTVRNNVVKDEIVKSSSLPDGWRLQVNKDWRAQFAFMDTITELHDKRMKLQKMITSYLPRMHYTDEEGIEHPADRIHAGFDCLKRTGRTSSRSSNLYPSWNGQQVDPRIRPCAIAEDGYSIVSIDYNAMELGTLAQTCINLFGFSVLGNVINKGEDAHGFLGAQIAYNVDSAFKEACDYYRKENDCKSHEDRVWSDYRVFKQLKKDDSECYSEDFVSIYESLYKEDKENTWSCFYAHYRKFAKPTGLGYPGGLGAKTFIQYARASFGVIVDLSTAEMLRDIWKETFPEMVRYLEHISKGSFDPNHQPVMEEGKDGKRKKKNFYSYDTPLGLHRAKTDFCACANGTGLQSPSAEGALLGLIEIQKLCYTSNDSALSRVGHAQAPVRNALFIHDEILGQFLMDGKENERISLMQEIMKTNMEKITPDVRAGTEPAMMYSWDKFAKTVYDDNGNLLPWDERG